MMFKRKLPLLSGLTIVMVSFALAHSAIAVQGPVKVFILAGQSNTEGHGRVETGVGNVTGAIGSLRYQVNNDAANYGHLVDGSNDWATRSDV